MRAQVEKKMAQKEKEKKEEKLRELAQMARDRRAGIKSHGDKGEFKRWLFSSPFPVCRDLCLLEKALFWYQKSDLHVRTSHLWMLINVRADTSPDQNAPFINCTLLNFPLSFSSLHFNSSLSYFCVSELPSLSPLFRPSTSISRSRWRRRRRQRAWRDPPWQKERTTARQEHFQGCSW